MNIVYTYEIISVDETARCMEVVYSASGHQTIHISTRLPFEGETLEQIIAAFSPVSSWCELAATVVVPVVGHSGVIDYRAPTEQAMLPLSEQDLEALHNAEMWEQIAFEKRTAAALVRFGVLLEDPTSIPVAEL